MITNHYFLFVDLFSSFSCMGHTQVQGHPPVTVMCSSTGAGHLVTNTINVKLIKGEPQKLNVQFDMPVSRPHK